MASVKTIKIWELESVVLGGLKDHLPNASQEEAILLVFGANPVPLRIRHGGSGRERLSGE